MNPVSLYVNTSMVITCDTAQRGTMLMPTADYGNVYIYKDISFDPVVIAQTQLR